MSGDFHQLYPHAHLYTLLYKPETVKDLGFSENQVTASFLNNRRGIINKYRRYLPFFPFAIEQLDLSEAEVILSSSHCGERNPDPVRSITYLLLPYPGTLRLGPDLPVFTRA
jgi:hypothetical protein